MLESEISLEKTSIWLHLFNLGKLLNQETKLISWQSDVQL